MTIELRSGNVGAVIDPDHGAEIDELWFGEHQIMARPGFLMAPWAGRIGGAVLDWGRHHLSLPADDEGNAKHGLVRKRPWDVDTTPTARRATLHCDVGEVWPGRADVEYTVDDHGMAITLSWASAVGLPCILGIHPWFRTALDDGSAMDLDAGVIRMAERDGHLPTGRFVEPTDPPWDDCFEVKADPVLRWGSVLDVRLSSSSRWWVIFTEPADAICVEPQTAPPDAFRHPELQPSTWVDDGSAHWVERLDMNITWHDAASS